MSAEVTRQGDRFTFSDGTGWLVESAPGERGDGALVFQVTLPAGGITPPPHRHPVATDSFEVLDGALSLKLDGAWRTLSPGETVDVEPGVVHTLANRSGAPVVLRNTHSPACDFDAFVAHADGMLREHGITRGRDLRLPILFSMLTLEYPQTLLPGRTRDAVATRTFALIGRRLGMSTGSAPR